MTIFVNSLNIPGFVDLAFGISQVRLLAISKQMAMPYLTTRTGDRFNNQFYRSRRYHPGNLDNQTLAQGGNYGRCNLSEVTAI
jgi:hypothetical protein